MAHRGTFTWKSVEVSPQPSHKQDNLDNGKTCEVRDRMPGWAVDEPFGHSAWENVRELEFPEEMQFDDVVWCS